jgi:D-threo-aldose 1-dehydrogenase
VPDLYGYAVDEERAVAKIRAVFDSSINFLDTSNNYGAGRAESRIGVALRQGAAPSGFVIATKVDANSETHDFSGDRVRRSFEESLERLGLDRVELLHLHDPEFHVDCRNAGRSGSPAPPSPCHRAFAEASGSFLVLSGSKPITFPLLR